MNDTPTTTIEEDDAGTSRRMDDELKAMGAIIRTLNELEEPARARIMQYLSSRYAAK